MTATSSTISVLIQEPFEQALHMIRSAILSDGLDVAADHDVSGKIRRGLGIGLPPFRVLSIDCPSLLLEATALDRSAAVLFPFHVVIAAQGRETMAHVLNISAFPEAALPIGLRAPLTKVQTRIQRLLERIAANSDSRQAAAEQAVHGGAL